MLSISLQARLLVAASLVLAIFLGIVSFALDRAFRESALVSVQERLQIEIYGLLAAAELNRANELILPEAFPEVRFSTPGSGLYSEVFADDGSSIWRSQSMLGMNIDFPMLDSTGLSLFSTAQAADGSDLFSLGLRVSWEADQGIEQGYTFWVAETQDAYEAQVKQFRRSLWTWLLAGSVLLLAAQAVILRWSLRPLRLVAWEVNQIEAGRKTELTETYPKELRGLTTNLNALVYSSSAHLKRYRNALGDLAHSLKTPLAVMRAALDGDRPANELRKTFSDQLERMDSTVHYQLQRAVASGRTILTAPVSVEHVVTKLVDSFNKVYAETPKTFAIALGSPVYFYGDEGDLMEILGNLIDNACKWSKRQIRISGETATVRASSRSTITLCVEDDGPGITEDKRRQVLGRGVRDDSTTQGHGIGLAIVKDLVVDVYGGELAFAESELGGLKVKVRIEF